MPESVYLRSRAACERVLSGLPVGTHVDIIEILRAAPGIHWRALQEALHRLSDEGRVYVKTRDPGWNRRPRIDHVVVRVVIAGPSGVA